MATIPEFFQAKNIFVTGGSGFIGKVLLEKILRSCPDVGNIYILLRSKRGKDLKERLTDLTNLPLFDVLRQKYPESFKKIVPVSGDCMELGLGLSPSDRQMLEENVSIVFHSAASVRFDDTLKYATLINARGTREVMLIARKMKHLEVLVHISTVYCICDRKVVEEVIYPPHADWRDIINIVENTDEHMLDVLTPKILGNLPNTYVFTKSLAEHVVKDLGENLPIVIIRPSIVISSLNDPFPGWIENFNGPVGLLIASGKGIVRVVFGSPNAVLDYMPVDVAVKLICIAAWEKARSGNLNPAVYNASSGKLKQITLNLLLDIGLEVIAENPLGNMLWKPSVYITDNRIIYFWMMTLLHLIPAILVDSLLKFAGKKPLDQVLAADKEFQLKGVEYADEKEVFASATKGALVYLLKEPEDRTQARRLHTRFWWLDTILRVVIIISLLWIVYYREVQEHVLASICTFVKSIIHGD
ncbi:putative fatty acyl-CoA reductase CG5065 isoform X2 [Cryptotermes secundus]|uniref:putative fatty acyl-CoA reductase CG5065 isoform X2 n=1 Tax=Cryptotermes secundus TaxID=105785 RepID=UPI000CD7BE65|nr:putative fatty acyl-CoA reductase CG5065 isoform X2 [Cryptotermes secundus]